MCIGTLGVFTQMPANGQTNESSDIISPTNKFLWFMESTNYVGQVDTNGLSFRLEMDNLDLRKTHCWIYICNLAWSDQKLQTSKRIYYWYDSNPFPRKDMKIELIDSKGQPVEKTQMGKQYGNAIDLKQVQETAKRRSQKWRTGWARTSGFTPATANWPLTSFNPIELFVPKEAGEYTLHVQMPLIQRVGNDEANPELKIIWLPEVFAKVEIRPEDIPLENLPATNQTNSPAK